ncbi:MAG TPA: selenocysteine-specific translation elongation factor [Streptosporangiaceae bacterium]|nr:selenocysteine-specific translation elongation factor [Streptosporangiaceae bacterium]
MHVVATAGHVDHGKSALIRALTGQEPDRWAEERRRGMTIDLGFGWFTLPSGDQLAFVDVPGHERFVPNMLAGTGPAPAVLFVVAADEGWMPQSAEHLAVIDALGISNGLIVITKCDLADPAPAMEQAIAYIAPTSLGAAPAVAVSAVTGAGMAELVAALDQLGKAMPEPDPSGPARIWIDRAFTMSGSGTVVTGTLPAGTVHRGDELVLAPTMRPVTVRELQSLGDQVEAVSGTARVALNLRGVTKDAVRRGMALVQAGRWTLTECVDVRLRSTAAPTGGHAGSWSRPAQPGPVRRLPGDECTSPVAAGPAAMLPRTVTVHVGAARVVARVRVLGPDLIRLGLANPLPLHVGDHLLLRDPGSRRTGSWPALAGGTVLDVMPPKLARRGAAASAARLLTGWPDQPTASHLLARHGLLRASTLLAMGIREFPEPVTGEWLADPDHWHALGHQLGEVVAGHAAAEPLAAGMPAEAARAALDLPDRRLVLALARPPFRVSGGLVQLTPAAGEGQTPGLPEPLQAALRVLRADLDAAPFASPDADRLRKLGLDQRSIAAAVRAGELMRISDQVVLAPGADKAAVQILARLPQPFTAAQAREALSTTRRTAIPLLEFLDLAGATERQADDRRIVRPPADPSAAGPAPARAEQAHIGVG